MDPMTIAAIGQASAGLGQVAQGIVQKSKANKIMRSNPRPTYYAPDETEENNDIAASRATRGLSDASYQGYVSNANRSMTASIDAITKNGGSANNISDLYGNVMGGFRNLAMLDEQMRANNIRMFMETNNQVGDAKDKEWQINTYAPYADKAQAAAALSKQGSDNLWKGINTVGSATGNAIMGNEYEAEGRQVFASTAPTHPDPNVFNSFSRAPSTAPQQQLTPVDNIRMQWPGLLYGKGAMEINY